MNNILGLRLASDAQQTQSLKWQSLFWIQHSAGTQYFIGTKKRETNDIRYHTRKITNNFRIWQSAWSKSWWEKLPKFQVNGPNIIYLKSDLSWWGGGNLFRYLEVECSREHVTKPKSLSVFSNSAHINIAGQVFGEQEKTQGERGT